MQLLTSQKKFLVPVHLHPKTDKWDYLRSPIMKFFSILVLTLGKFLEALGSGIGTGSIFCLSFSLSNRVQSPLNLNHFCLTRFQIEEWLKLIGRPSVDIFHQSDWAQLCCLLYQYNCFLIYKFQTAETSRFSQSNQAYSLSTHPLILRSFGSQFC